MKNALLNGFVERGNRSAENLLGGSFVTSGQSLAHFTKNRPEARRVATIPLGTSCSLAGALKRRKVVCHYFNCLLVGFVRLLVAKLNFT